MAIITEGDLTKPKADLVTFENKFGLPHVPWNTVQVGTPSTDTAGDDEWDLDTQYSTGLAPTSPGSTSMTARSLSNDDILATINRWVSDNSTRQASFSAGECEVLAQVTGFTDCARRPCSRRRARRARRCSPRPATPVVLPGRPRRPNGVPGGHPGVEYPASSPNAIGVGGTTVLGNGPNEIAWYAGGGGTSLFEAVPAWQANAGGSFTGVGRGVPDVSLDADPNSGYDVIVGGTDEEIGGTSASARPGRASGPARRPPTAARSASPARCIYSGRAGVGSTTSRSDQRRFPGHARLGLHHRPRYARYHRVRERRLATGGRRPV